MMPLHTQNPGWQQQMADVVTDGRELCRILHLDPARLQPPLLADSGFTMRVPRAFINRMEPGNPEDPLLLQVLASAVENIPVADFHRDPVGDTAALRQPGLLHKYHGRVLLVTTGACAVHCRYCFRRHYPYGDAATRGNDTAALLRYLHDDTSIKEVILSGGDPLTLSDNRLQHLLAELHSVPHLTTLRVHTRIPTIIPDRIGNRFLDIFRHSPLAKVMVVHVNHPRELTALERGPFQELRDAGFFLLNQSVLLKRINDDATTLAQLSASLFDLGILPYYLHQLDKVHGAGHFQVTDAVAGAIYHALASLVPGYLLPKFVRDIPGQPHKTLYPFHTNASPASKAWPA